MNRKSKFLNSFQQFETCLANDTTIDVDDDGNELTKEDTQCIELPKVEVVESRIQVVESPKKDVVDNMKGIITYPLVICFMVRGNLTNTVADIWIKEITKKKGSGWNIQALKEYHPLAQLILCDSSCPLDKFLQWCKKKSAEEFTLSVKATCYILQQAWGYTLIKYLNNSATSTAVNWLAQVQNDVKNPVYVHDIMHELYPQEVCLNHTSNNSSSSSKNVISGSSKSVPPPSSDAESKPLPSSITFSQSHPPTNNSIYTKIPHATLNKDGNSKLININQATFACVNSTIMPNSIYNISENTNAMIPSNQNKHITDILEDLQKLYEGRGDDFRYISYKRCIDMLKKKDRIVHIDQLKGIKGIGKSLLDKIEEIIRTGSLLKLEHFNQDPKVAALSELTQVWGIGTKKAQELIKMGYMSRADLRAREDEVGHLDGILTRQQQIGLMFHEEFELRIPRAEMDEMFLIVKEQVDKLCPGSECIIAGSYRRGALDSGDIDILVFPPARSVVQDVCRESTSETGIPGSPPHSPATGSVGSNKRACVANDPELPAYKSLYLPDLLHVLESTGFLTHHLSYPHITPGAGVAGSVSSGGTGTATMAAEGSEDEDPDAQGIEDLDSGEGNPKDHLKYLGVCKLPHSSIHRRIDIWTYPRSMYAYALIQFTGSDHFIRSMRNYAAKIGYTLTDKGLYACIRDNKRNKIATQSKKVICYTEKDIFDYFQLPYKEPWERNIF